MRSRTTSRAVLMLLAAILLTTIDARAADDEFQDEYEEQARVVRVSLLRGEVTLRRAGSGSWESARLNSPLVEGDTLATGHDARVEIQIDARNFVRLGADSVLSFVALRDEGIALSLAEGTASVRLAQFDGEREYFEVDAPKSTLAAEKRGLYRLDAGRDGRVRVTVRGGGRARIYSETSGFTLRDDRMAELVYDGAEAGDWELSRAGSFDDWDRWNDDRERDLAARLRYEERERYYDREVWGAEELDAYGDWSYAGDYGWVWRPHATVIGHYSGWAPYRYGHWTWCPPYGWTWVADEPWGWAPYHYGRWVYYNNSWRWAPRGYGYRYGRSWWRPALVAFVYLPTSYGEHVAWYPLGYGQRDPRGRNFRRLAPLRPNDAASLRRTNPALLRAVTTLPVRDFATGATRARPATTELAHRAAAGEPVRGRLPVAPSADSTGRSEALDTAGRARPGVARPPGMSPARALPQRPTGAATRTPGIALDGELRRERVFRNRDPRPTAPDGIEGGNPRVDGRTGAVARPARPDGLVIRRSAPRDAPEPPRVRRPPAVGDAGGSVDTPTDEPRRRPAPDARPNPPRRQPPAEEARPPAPPAEDRPDTRERSRPREADRPRPAPEERPQPSRPPRQEPPRERAEPPPPPPRHDPPPARSEPPPSRAPEQRESPPPPRERTSPGRDAPRPPR